MRRRTRYRRNPEGESRSGGSMVPLLVGGAVLYFLASRPGGLSSLFPAGGLFSPSTTPLVNPNGAYIGGVYYPPGVPIPTAAQQLGTAVQTAGITAGIATVGSALSDAIRSWFTGPSASTVNSGGGTASAAPATQINPSPSAGLWIGDTSVGRGPVVVGDLGETHYADGYSEELAYAEAIGRQGYEDAEVMGQFVSDAAAYSEGYLGV